MPDIQQYIRQRLAERNENAFRVLDFLHDYIAEQNISPSISEIADACFISRSNVSRYLDLLEAWGYITRMPGVPRSISLLSVDHPAVKNDHHTREQDQDK